MRQSGTVLRLVSRHVSQSRPLYGFSSSAFSSENKSKSGLLSERRFSAVIRDALLLQEGSSGQKGHKLSPLHHVKIQHPRGFLGVADGDEDSGLCRHYEETRIIGYSPQQLFSVVAAVDLYEDFVPWCQRSTILCKNDKFLEAELEIGFKFFVEQYISHVELKHPKLIKTSVSQSKLFDFLNNIWEFHPGPVPGSCKLHVVVDFQFRSPLYRRIADSRANLTLGSVRTYAGPFGRSMNVLATIYDMITHFFHHFLISLAYILWEAAFGYHIVGSYSD